MIQKISDYIVDSLIAFGITECFTVTGGGAMHLNDSFGHHKGMHCTYNHHEQACSMAAEGFTRTCGKMAVVCVTSGPGSTNTITGVMGAWLDSIPMLVISGQMKFLTTIKSTSVPLRQLGFQEFNIVDSVSCMTKYAVMIDDPMSVAFHLEQALFLATHGRPGPVWLDIPLDVQAAKVDVEKLPHFDASHNHYSDVPDVSQADLDLMLDKINQSKKPVILAGNGVRISGGHNEFLKVIEKLGIPVVTAWNAHDLIWDEHPLYCGRPGTIGNRGGNFVVQNSDLLISFGCRLNIRQISYDWKNFAKNAYKIAIDIDKGELQKPTLNLDFPIHADLKDVFNCILGSTFKTGHSLDSKWLKWCKHINHKYPVVLKEYYSHEKPLNPYVFMKELSDLLVGSDIIVASNGTASVCSFQAIEIKEGERMFSNAGASSMGYGIAAAIGASRSMNNIKRIICLEGDGSIQMNIQELQTIVHNKLDIKVFWINNDGYHSIRQTQAQSFNAEERGYCGVNGDSGISFPSAEKIAYAYGLKFEKIESILNIKKQLQRVLTETGPFICEVVVDPNQNFEPKLTSKLLPDGTFLTPSLEDMFPFLSEEEMKQNKFQLD